MLTVRPPPLEVAAIWIPAHVDPLDPHVMACLSHTRRCRYDLLGIITAAPWDEVRQMMTDGRVDVVVVSDPDHLPADRTPRIEVAAGRPIQPPAAFDVAPARGRPRRRRS